jgi:hypothetical protein
MKAITKILLLLIITSFLSGVANADEVTITTEFTPSATNPSNNKFTNTTAISGFCGRYPNSSYCSTGAVTIGTRINATNRSLNVLSNDMRDQVYQRVNARWRSVQLYDLKTRKSITVSFRISGMFLRFKSNRAWELNDFNNAGRAPVGTCNGTTNLYNSITYEYGWTYEENGGECHKPVKNLQMNDVIMDSVSIGYELTSPSPMTLPNGEYVGSITYDVGNNSEIDLGNATYNHNELKINIRTTIKHDFKVEHTSSQKVMLEPQDGWDSILGSSNAEIPLLGNSSFALTASAPFSLYLECEHSQLGSCALQKEGSDEKVPVIVSVSMPQMRNMFTGEAVKDMTLPMKQNHLPNFNLEPIQFNDAAASTIQFRINGPSSRKMISQPGTNWKGAVTLIFDADLPFVSH